MISLDHAEKITTGLMWLGAAVSVLCVPIEAALFVLLAYIFLIGPYLVVLLPPLVLAAISIINLLLCLAGIWKRSPVEPIAWEERMD